MPRRKYTDEDLLSNLQEFAEELGRTPSQPQMNKKGPHYASTYRRRFGSWNKAIEKAGLEVNDRQNIPERELLEELKRLAKVFGRPPKTDDMEEFGRFSESLYWNRFGSWNTALQEAGLPVKYKMTSPDEQEVIEELTRISEIVGRTPRQKDMEEHGVYSVNTCIRRFGTWNDAVRASGFEPALDLSTRTYEEDYGKGWTKAKKKAIRERDGRECQVCGLSQQEHIEDLGFKLHVHHIVPARLFSNPQKRNDPDNLITLCAECHRRWEGIPLRPQ